MAEFVMAKGSLKGESSFRLIGESRTGLPVRVEVRGTGRHRFTLISPDRTRSYTTLIDYSTDVSRTIDEDVASLYASNWKVGAEGGLWRLPSRT